MKDYLKHLGYSFLTIFILFFLVFIFYFYFSNVSIEATYQELNNSEYLHKIKIENGWDLNLGELSLIIHDLEKSSDDECYQFDTGGKINLMSSFARCEISRDTSDVSVNVLPLHCDYFDKFGEIEISWVSYAEPRNCSFIIDYSHEGPQFVPFRIPRREVLKFSKN
jgi:hypothetical protein